MIRELEIQGVKVRLRTDGAIPIVYRSLFGRDFLMDTTKITNYGTTVADFSFSEIYDIIYAMAFYAGYKKSETEWYGQFPALIDIFGLWKEASAMLNEDFATKKDQ